MQSGAPETVNSPLEQCSSDKIMENIRLGFEIWWVSQVSINLQDFLQTYLSHGQSWRERRIQLGVGARCLSSPLARGEEINTSSEVRVKTLLVRDENYTAVTIVTGAVYQRTPS